MQNYRQLIDDGNGDDARNSYIETVELGIISKINLKGRIVLLQPLSPYSSSVPLQRGYRPDKVRSPPMQPRSPAPSRPRPHCPANDACLARAHPEDEPGLEGRATCRHGCVSCSTLTSPRRIGPRTAQLYLRAPASNPPSNQRSIS
jgi:hypothetical protein